LTASSATGLGAITGVTGLVGGAGYSAGTTVTIIDAPTSQNNGPGPAPARPRTPTVVAGVITAINIIDTAGAGYLNPQFVIRIRRARPAAGASAHAACSTTARPSRRAPTTFTNPGQHRPGHPHGRRDRDHHGLHSTTQVTANINSPIVELIPNTTTPQPAAAGDWTLTAPVATISGLRISPARP
jgi:hypothetical protein